MRIGRTIPPAASPIYFRDIVNGFGGLIHPRQKIERFKSELKEYFGVKHVFLVSSGKAALTTILKALHILRPEKDEVLIPAFCCYSVPSAIVRAGLTVKLCDVDRDTLDFNYENLISLLSGKPENHPDIIINHPIHQPNGSAEAVDSINTANSQLSSTQNRARSTNTMISTARLLAVIPIHLFGLLSDVERVREIVDDPEIAIVEDAAQVLGSEKDGKEVGTFGDVSFLSLGRSKSISAVEGGIILTDNHEIAQQISKLVDNAAPYSIYAQIGLILQALGLAVFQRPSFFWFPKLLPFLRVGDTIYDSTFEIYRLSGFQAGLARNWRARLKDFQERRKKISMRWASTVSRDYDYNHPSGKGIISNFIRYPIRIKDTKLWQETLEISEKKGLGVMLTYPASINGIAELKEMFLGQNFPAAEKLPHQLVTLPVHPYVTPKDKERILQALTQLKMDR